ncbi:MULTISPECIES: hypothetical protein [unclassified Sedimentibacter]|uniref:hypothetical protein n=1 Tax=unclassified Sedimentibacter TaxID=2649220 RepID=UPI0027E1AF9C|nr:hypothetical protein [Sedimentibacter sp. MB35-C1]WMJ76765.1 hypothetical protein RBQ61_14485 [Sedimentibacter sp. MB35-C1]
MGLNNNNVAGTGRRRNCEFVYECLLELLEEASDNNGRRRCDFVYECLEELLEDAGDNGNNNCHCCCPCCCRRC